MNYDSEKLFDVFKCVYVCVRQGTQVAEIKMEWKRFFFKHKFNTTTTTTINF